MPSADTALGQQEHVEQTTGRVPSVSLMGAAAIVMFGFVGSRLTGLLREVAVTYSFGVGRDMDAYLAAIRIPDLVFQVVAGGAVASAFIPVFSSYLATGHHSQGWRLVNTLLTLSVVILSPLIIVLIVLAPSVMQLLAPEFEPEYQVLASEMSRILLISPLFFTLGCFITSVLHAHQRFFMAALAPITYNLGIIAGALLLAPAFGIRGLAFGAVAGSLLFLLVQIPGLFQLRMTYRPILDLHHPGVREVGKLMVPRALGLAVTQVNLFVALYLASGIAGGVAALNWAWQLTMLPLGVFAMAVSTAVFPSLSAQFAQRQMAEMGQMVTGALRFILFLTIPASIGLLVLPEPIIRLLFERGQFDAASTEMTAQALRLYAPGLFAMATVEIVTRVFYAFHDTRTPVLVAAGTMIANALLAVVLIRVLSHAGLALATTIASVGGAVVLYHLARQRLPQLEHRGVLTSAVKSATSALGMAIAVLGFSEAAAAHLPNTALVVGALAIGLTSYVSLAALLRCGEIDQLRRLVLGYLGRLASSATPRW